MPSRNVHDGDISSTQIGNLYRFYAEDDGAEHGSHVFHQMQIHYERLPDHLGAVDVMFLCQLVYV